MAAASLQPPASNFSWDSQAPRHSCSAPPPEGPRPPPACLARPGSLRAPGEAMRLRALTRGPPGGCMRRTRERRHRRQVSGCGALRAGAGGDRGEAGAGARRGVVPSSFRLARACRAQTLVCARARAPLSARAWARSYARLCALICPAVRACVPWCVHAGEDKSGKGDLAWWAGGARGSPTERETALTF